MKKNSANIKGFAMTELLTVSIIILLIFTVLVSNYLPLLSEYENRTSFTNVTADYAAFYIRKLYKSALEDTTTKANGKTRIDILNSTFTTGDPPPGYKQIYTSNTGLTNTLLSSEDEARLTKIINAYDIEEITLTTYKLTHAKTTYKKSTGVLYDYIKYLPNYTRSKYGSSHSYTQEPYRIILKTRDYGYATTQIMPDPPTPSICFKYEWNTAGKYFVVTEYTPEVSPDCQENQYSVVIGGSFITAPDSKSHATYTGQVKEIGPNAFKNAGIKSIDLEKNVTVIGESAFEGNEISVLHITNQMPGITSMGDNAFRNNKLTQLIVPNKTADGKSDITYGTGVFSNNYQLKALKFDFMDGDYDENGNFIPDVTGVKISDSMFAMEFDAGNPQNTTHKQTIGLSIPRNVTEIGEAAFKNIKLSSLTFEGLVQDDEENLNVSMLKQIGDSAFEQDQGTLNLNTPSNNPYIQIFIPYSVTEIGDYAFYNVLASDISIEDRPDIGETKAFKSKLDIIGSYAFGMSTNIVNTSLIDRVCNDFKNPDKYEDYKDIYYSTVDGTTTCIYKDVRAFQGPSSVTYVGDHALANQYFASIDFNDKKEDGTIDTASSLEEIGSSAFVGNSLESFEMPGTVTAEAMGNNIFGENSSMGNQVGTIVIRNEELFNETALWCKALYGSEEGCTLNYSSGRGGITEQDKQEALESCTTSWQEGGYDSEADCRADISTWVVVTNPNLVYACKKDSQTKYITQIK